jgi:hypothetical protein
MPHRFDPTILREYDIRGIVAKPFLPPTRVWPLQRGAIPLERRGVRLTRFNPFRSTRIVLVKMTYLTV